tara:strand:- start:805 stop:1266 length:462 start_codon:yes stop_codon:yes gene_type:complete
MIDLSKITDELLERELLVLVEELKAKHIELGQKASGKWIESLEVVVSGGKGIIYGTGYTQYLTKGRTPGARPPINPLKEWAKVKLGVSDKEALNVAFAVATKIANEGTDIYKSGGSDLVDGVITDKRVRQMFENIGKTLVTNISKDLTRELAV